MPCRDIGRVGAIWYTVCVMNINNYIVADPRICHGKPTFKDTRIMVYLVLGLLEAGVPTEEIIGHNYYPQLTRKHIEAALHYAGSLLKTREYVAQVAL